MIGKHTITTSSVATLLIGITLHGWLGTASTAHAGGEYSGSELSGYVYADMDIDNVLDPFEAGIAEVEIVLTMLSDPNFSVSMLSNLSGYYEFTGLNPGVYSITQPVLPMAVRNVSVSEGVLQDIVTSVSLSANAGTAVLLNQTQGILPHVEGIDLAAGARGTGYNFGQIYFGKAWLTTDPPPITPEGGVPEPATGLLLAISGLLLGTARRQCGRR